MKKGTLKKAFNITACAGVGAGSTLLLGGVPLFAVFVAICGGFVGDLLNQKFNDALLYPTFKRTFLTEGEVSLVKSIFGDAIDTSIVRKHYTKENKGCDKWYVPASVFSKKKVKFYGEGNYEDDYSSSRDIFNFTVFAHEMTHIWQRQNKRKKETAATLKGDVYEYELSQRKSFKDFGCEQQASIIEDYARQFLFAGSGSNRRSLNPPSAVRDSLLQKTVEEQFPESRKTRISLENLRGQKSLKHPLSLNLH